MQRRIAPTAAALACLVSLVSLASLASVASNAVPAHASGTRVIAGTDTRDINDMFLTYVGCDDFFGSATAPGARVNLGPHTPRAGRRSLGLVPTAGTAAGPHTTFTSLNGLNNAVSVTAKAGTRGVSWLWARPSTTFPGTAWRGRAEVTIWAEGWTTVRAADLTYTWTLVDLQTRRPVAQADPSTPAAFARRHGDGRGSVMTGFGCDAGAFNIDAVQAADTTWDFEGITLTTRIGGVPDTAQAGDKLTITGTVTDESGRKTGDPLVLERRTPTGAWTPAGPPALADRDGMTRMQVVLDETTEFRWHRPQSQYADEGYSDPATARVANAS